MQNIYFGRILMEESKSSMQNNEKAVGKTYDFFTKNSRQISEKMTNLK